MDFHKYFGNISEELTKRYKKGFKIDDCDERRAYWLSMWDYIDEIDLTGSLMSATYFFGNEVSFEEISAVNALNDDTERKIEVLDYCAGSGYRLSICDMCTDAWGSIIQNYINQVYIYLDYLEANRAKENIDYEHDRT